MAKIRVYRDEADGAEFPRLCVRCGADADLDRRNTFSWMPGWVNVLILAGLAPWLIVVALMRKTMRVTLPVCHRHRNHWLNRRLYVGLGLFLWVVAAVAAAVMADKILRDAAPAVVGFFVFGGLAWLIGGLVLVHGAVKAGEITDRWIELVKVDRGFADAWEEVHPPRPRRRPRRRYDEEDADRPRGWRDEEDDRDDRPRRRNEFDEGDDRPRRRRDDW